MHEVVIVIPCYNEARRLDTDAFRAFFETDDVTGFVFVNDGSTDGTLARLTELRESTPGRVRIVDLPANVGKAEAVRQGMLFAMESGARYAGYWDADLATPLRAIPTFCTALDHREDVDLVLGARVRLLGRTIERRARRHYLGRVFATAVSLVLRLPVYDTQCGAKLFRINRRTACVFFEPFRSRWIFDVEIIGRLIHPDARNAGDSTDPAERLYELPLLEWRDVPGTKLRLMDFMIAAVDLMGLYMNPGGRSERAAEGAASATVPESPAEPMARAPASAIATQADRRDAKLVK